MTIERKSTQKGMTPRDLVPGLDASAIGVVSLAEWKGTRLEQTAQILLPQARSVVVFGEEVYLEFIDLTSPESIKGPASLNDLFALHTDFLAGRLTKAAYDLARACRKIGMKAMPLSSKGSPYDTRFLEAIFSYKHAAEAAGLGKFGWHSLIMSPTFGPRIRFSCLLTEVEFEPTRGDMVTNCKSCGLCVGICPSGAIAEPKAGESYSFNKSACNLFRSGAGGCNECLRICPIGR